MNSLARCSTATLFLILLLTGCGRQDQAATPSTDASPVSNGQKADNERLVAENRQLREQVEQLKADKKTLEDRIATLRPRPPAAGGPNDPQPPASRPTPPSKDTPPPGPVVFENSLFTPDALDHFFCSFGAYGGEAAVVAGSGLRIGGGWTGSTVWAKPLLGGRYRVEFEVQLPEGTAAAWLLSGPGCGSSLDAGYCCRFDRSTLSLLRNGEEKQKSQFPQPMAPAQWTSVSTEVNEGELTVRVNDVAFVHFSDPNALTGPLHGWFGMHGGGAVFRNLRIWSAASDINRERQLTPPISESPRANGLSLYDLKLTGGQLDRDWWISQPDAVVIQQGELVLSEHIRTKSWRRNAVCNSRPVLILTRPLPPSDLACEVEFEYPADEAQGFAVMLCAAKSGAPTSPKQCEGGWFVKVPEGHGKNTVHWHRAPKDTAGEDWFGPGEVLASTPYFAAVSERKYSLRIEWLADNVRVFLDGGLLLTAKRPSTPELKPSPVFLGISQSHSGSRVHALRVFSLSSDTGKAK